MKTKGAITKLIFNWFPPVQEGYGEEFETREVGVHGVESIEEHAAAGEGDKWYYDVYCKDGTSERIFNPNKVAYGLPTNLPTV